MRHALPTTHPELVRQWHPDLNEGLRPSDVSSKSADVVWWICGAVPPHVWQASVRARAGSDSGCPKCVRRPIKLLRDHYPELAREWHPEKNLPLRLEDIGTGSDKRMWWRCSSDPSHEWQALVSCRIKTPRCPICTGWLVTPKTSFAGLYPRLAKEWHPTKNGELRPDQVRPGSAKRVWWRCSKNPLHEWNIQVFARSRSHTGCPVCNGHALSPEVTLAAMYPEVAREWHPSRNGSLRPDQVRWGAERKVWWRCARNRSHEWCASVTNRTRHGTSCPMCTGRVTTKPRSILTLVPELLPFWHPTKNGKLTPDKVAPGAKKRIWWRCITDPSHEWHAVPTTSGCPVCCGKKVILSNSLAGVRPELLKEWHPVRNGDLKPEQLYYRSLKRVFWVCSRDPVHEWEATIVSRAKNGSGCPFCGGRAAGPNTSLAARYPDVAKQWHPTKNGKLTPDDVTPGTTTRAWWRCSKNHEWESPIRDRVKATTDCRECWMSKHKLWLAERNRARAKRR